MSHPDPSVPQREPTPVESALGGGGVSAAAVSSLIFGILGCLVVTPLLAIIFGIVGLKATSAGQRAGRGLAIAGLVLGCVWAISFAGCGGGIYSFYVASKPVAKVAEAFMGDLVKHDVVSAQSRCELSITPMQLENMSAAIVKYGPYLRLSLPVRNVESTPDQTIWELKGVAEFGDEEHNVSFRLVKRSDGSYRIRSAQIE